MVKKYRLFTNNNLYYRKQGTMSMQVSVYDRQISKKKRKNEQTVKPKKNTVNQQIKQQMQKDLKDFINYL